MPPTLGIYIMVKVQALKDSQPEKRECLCLFLWGVKPGLEAVVSVCCRL